MDNRGIYLLLGSNLGNRLAHLANALQQLAAEAGCINQLSAIYETAAWGKTDQPAFLNQVIRISSSLTPENLLDTILAIEQTLGRTRQKKWAARTIDIDILFYHDQIIEQPNLTIPHPELPNRRFALEPLAEIAPHFVHPALQKTIEELLSECPDKLAVKKCYDLSMYKNL